MAFSDLSHPWMLLLIPVISGAVGYGTNMLAIQMLRYPVEFRGVRPFLGWQGILPASAGRLGRHLMSVVERDILGKQGLREIFRGEAMDARFDAFLAEATDEVLAELAAIAPEAWANAGDEMQGKVRARVREELSEILTRYLDRLAGSADELLDLESIVQSVADEDPEIIGDLFFEIGTGAIRLLERSGLWLGLAFGFVQMGVWLIYPAWWILPFFGFLVGYATNWVAVYLIFNPKSPVAMGPLKIHGVMYRDQRHIAGKFAEVVSARILSTERITAHLMSERSRTRILEVAREEIGAVLDRYAAEPLVQLMIRPEQLDALRLRALEQLDGKLGGTEGPLSRFANRESAFERALHERICALEPATLEKIWRPVVQADEWKLMAVGGALGAVAGGLQTVYVVGRMLGGG
jgi:uncharacterized membrane protein YheB (UPF0754 family)